MLITILTAGSRGDTQPYIALGKALQQAGSRVRLATHENFSPFVQSHGLEFFPIRGDVSAVAASDEVRSARQADNPLKFLLSFQQLKKLVYDLQQDFYAACGGSDAIIYHPAAAIGYFAAHQLGIPSILASPFPMTPTNEYPALLFYNLPRLGKAWNRLTHRLFEQIMWSSGSPVRRFWKQQFGSNPPDFGCPYPRQVTRRQPTVISCSQHVFPRPKDWPEHVHSPGYWFLDEEEGWQPSPELLSFLERGRPPVYVGFGSIGEPTQAAQTTALVMEALKLAGQRGILAIGWQGMARPDNLPEDMFVLESAPHAWLFPRMAAVVHHGGAGTTAAGLRAGVPGVVVPFSNDNFAWGRRLFELGVAARPVPRKTLNSDQLAGAITRALSAEITAAARLMGEKIRAENGAARAAQIILDAIAV